MLAHNPFLLVQARHEPVPATIYQIHVSRPFGVVESVLVNHGRFSKWRCYAETTQATDTKGSSRGDKTGTFLVNTKRLVSFVFRRKRRSFFSGVNSSLELGGTRHGCGSNHEGPRFGHVECSNHSWAWGSIIGILWGSMKVW